MDYEFGIDVSKWDAYPVNWGAANMRYHFVKVSEGTVIDPLFYAHWNGARGHTLRGAYHFFRPFVDPKLSAQRTVEHLAGDYGELPLALDIETTDGRTDTLARAKVWKDEFERITGTRIMIYSRVEFMKSIGVTASTSWLKDVDFWVAQYPFDTTTPTWTLAQRTKRLHDMVTGEYEMGMPGIDVLPPLKTQIWQWTARGNPADVPGYYLGWDGKKEVDFNFARPEWLGLEQPPDTEEPMNEYEVTVTWDSGASVRHNQNTGGTPITIFPKGTKFIASEIVPDSVYPTNNLRRWARIKGGTYDGKYLAVEYDTPRCSYVLIGDPPPPSGELPVLTVMVTGEGYNPATVDLIPK